MSRARVQIPASPPATRGCGGVRAPGFSVPPCRLTPGPGCDRVYRKPGEMSEWFMELVLKTSDPARGRGVESPSLRHAAASAKPLAAAFARAPEPSGLRRFAPGFGPLFGAPPASCAGFRAGFLPGENARRSGAPVDARRPKRRLRLRERQACPPGRGQKPFRRHHGRFEMALLPEARFHAPAKRPGVCLDRRDRG